MAFAATPTETLAGVFPVLPTPLTEADEVDIDALRTLARALLSCGVHGLVSAGSTSEAPYLSFEERVRVIEAVARESAGERVVIAGVGQFSTRETLRLARAALDAGATALLVLVPAYFAPSFDMVLDHLRRLADAVSAPVLYYHFPGVSHLPLSGEQLEVLGAMPELAGAKLSVADRGAFEAVARGAAGRPFSLLAGSSPLLSEAMALGACGVICGLPTLWPQAALACYEAGRVGDFDAARRHADRLFELLPLTMDLSAPVVEVRQAMRHGFAWGREVNVDARAFIARLKAALGALGYPMSARVRAPLPSFDETRRPALEQVITALWGAGLCGVER